MSIEDYLLGCRNDPLMHASAPERLLAAIGEPEIIDTSRDQRLGRIFMNRTIRRYKSFTNFYGMEGTIEHIASFLRHASQGLEERKQIIYLLGPRSEERRVGTECDRTVRSWGVAVDKTKKT